MEFQEKKLNRTNIYHGKVIEVVVDKVLCPNGNESYREIVKHHGGVCLLALDENQNIFMEKQYRYAYDEIIYELPAGKLEKGEDSYQAGMREFEEETGYKPITLISLGCMYPTCGYSNEIIYLYLVDQFVPSQRHLDEDEVIEIIKMPLKEVEEKIANGIIKDAKTICMLYKYQLYKQQK